jgi:polyisoprenoid-binding protein YceI
MPKIAFRWRMPPKFTPIHAGELARRLASAQPPVLLDVRLAEDCECLSLPDARSNCVYEVAFSERMAAMAPDVATPVCVFGSAADSLESQMAAEKLCRLGYAEVLDFRDGVEGWSRAGYPLAGSGSSSANAPTIADGTHPIDLITSRIEWIGRNLLNHHRGTIGLKSGELRITGGQLTGGHFVIDMQNIQCSDLAGDSLHDVLIQHLLSHDFFDSDHFPDARFDITRAATLPDASPGAPNLTIAGTLLLKGVAKPIKFHACSGLTAEGKLAAQATMAFDRTRWNVMYGSGRWFRHLGRHLVNDLIELQMRIVTE